MRNKTGLNLGWVFLGGFTKKNLPGYFLGIYPGVWTLAICI